MVDVKESAGAATVFIRIDTWKGRGPRPIPIFRRTDKPQIPLGTAGKECKPPVADHGNNTNAGHAGIMRTFIFNVRSLKDRN
jgi:hypothetical protein